jgi:shikimate dehydrogenase
MRLFGLIGYPLTQSFSKKYFEKKFEQQGLTDCRFENFSIVSINELPTIIESNPDLAGLAVTIPYKKTIIPLLHNRQHIPAGLDACNCIRVINGKLEGYNTDHAGFEKSFVPLLKSHHHKALVLGNGGATEAVTFVLRKHGITYEIVSRQLHDDSSLTYDQLDEKIMQEHRVIINTTPLGMYPSVEQCPPIPYEFIGQDHLLYDLIYNPPLTLFLRKGKEKGATIMNGEDMLVLQAEENWRIWNTPANQGVH